MRKVKKILLYWALAAVGLGTSWFLPPILQLSNGIRDANAIPVFARKYRTSCTTCHAPVPIKLNNFGEAFKNNGFRMPADDEALTKIEMQELGAEARKEIWYKDIYPGALPSELPISWQMYLDARYDPHKESAGTRNARDMYWDMPHEFEIMTAGTLGKNISFWGNMEFKVKSAQSVGTSSGSATKNDIKAINETPVDFVQVYGQFDHILDTSLLNVRFGRFEPRAVPFSRVSRRFIAEDFLFAGHSLSNGFNFKTMQGGAELWGAKSIARTGGGLLYAVGSLNGDGNSNGDNNRKQDFYARLSYKFGGFGVSESLASGGNLNASGNWVDNSIRVGLYSYQGHAGSSALGFGIGGADVDVWYKNLNLYATVWEATEDLSSTKTQDSTAFSVGADYIVVPWLTGILRYEGADQGTTASKHIRRVIPAVVVGLRPNVTWTTETHLYNKVGNLKTGDEVVRSRLRFIF